MISKKNRCIPPRGFLKNILKEAPHVLIRDLDKNENGDFARLNFHINLLDSVENNLNANLAFHQTEGVDLKSPQLLNLDTLAIRLILNSDGFQLNESLVNLSAWPLWVAMADLTPMKRAAFKIMTLYSSFFGEGKLEFQKMFDHFLYEYAQGNAMQATSNIYKVEFIPILTIADLIAKANLLKMRQYNGCYG